ncbi:hypothetical protein [Streptomyces winkii]|uniref:hypothetical protein n=1 Tax=Streptomyces winkii TaxID=3051178 RepID=UPI0028D87634|nr:hypothetical protein [Streptomyces sp. DSM 40971]
MVLKDLWRSFREFNARQVETWERIQLLNSPWEEDFVHWARGEDGWELHGRLPPPRDRHTRSVTRSGWCPGLKCPEGPGGRQPPVPDR